MDIRTLYVQTNTAPYRASDEGIIRDFDAATFSDVVAHLFKKAAESKPCQILNIRSALAQVPHIGYKETYYKWYVSEELAQLSLLQ